MFMSDYATEVCKCPLLIYRFPTFNTNIRFFCLFTPPISVFSPVSSTSFIVIALRRLQAWNIKDSSPVTLIRILCKTYYQDQYWWRMR